MLSADRGSGANTGGTSALRNTLRAGESLEVAGYELTPELASAIDGLKAVELAVTDSPSTGSRLWLRQDARSHRQRKKL